mgnify:CR=1 FL=1|jgi:hypothetical protein
MKSIASTFLIVACLVAACSQAPFATEKVVIFSVSAGFRGPILFRIDPANDALPQVRESEVVYSVPPSGIVSVRSMDLSNGARWDHYMARYPDGALVKSYGYGDKIEPSQDYLFTLGSHHYQGKSLELFMVATVDERLKFQSKPLLDLNECFKEWALIPNAK